MQHESRRGMRAPTMTRAGAGRASYFIFDLALRRSAQYRFIRSETARRAAADIVRVRSLARLIDRLSARRRLGRASSGNVRSMAMTSARSSFNVCSAPLRASSRTLAALSSFAVLGICDLLSMSILLYKQRCSLDENAPPGFMALGGAFHNYGEAPGGAGRPP